MSATKDVFEPLPDALPFLVVFFLVALVGGTLSAVTIAHALGGRFMEAAPGAIGLIVIGVAHIIAKREGYYSVIAELILSGAGVGAVAGSIVHLVCTLTA